VCAAFVLARAYFCVSVCLCACVFACACVGGSAAVFVWVWVGGWALLRHHAPKAAACCCAALVFPRQLKVQGVRLLDVQAPSGSDEEEPRHKGKQGKGKAQDAGARAGDKKGKSHKKGAATDAPDAKEAAELELLLMDDEKLRWAAGAAAML